MNFRPNPLLYGATEDFFGSFKLVVTMRDVIDHELLSLSVANAMRRYPYFSVYPKKEGESIVLQQNDAPVPVFADSRCALLGSEESNGHLITFGCEDKRIFLNASHYIVDGMGVCPLLMTVLYLYSSLKYGDEGLNAAKILMPDGEISDKEYEYPFASLPLSEDECALPSVDAGDVYPLDGEHFDNGGLYAYHLRISSKEMMKMANSSDGSPVSFLSVLLYRALYELDNTIEKPIVAHVQHQYRAAINAPLNRHSLVSYIPVVLFPKLKDWHIERQNTVVRGQIIVGSEKSADIGAVNRLLSVFPNEEAMSLTEKEAAMRRYIEESTEGKTFGISYVGKMDWCGLDRYVEDIHAYIGERDTENMLLMEVMTIGDDFSVNFMQSGSGKRYLDAFMNQLEQLDIPVSLVGEERFTLCGTKIPQ